MPSLDLATADFDICPFNAFCLYDRCARLGINRRAFSRSIARSSGRGSPMARRSRSTSPTSKMGASSEQHLRCWRIIQQGAHRGRACECGIPVEVLKLVIDPFWGDLLDRFLDHHRNGLNEAVGIGCDHAAQLAEDPFDVRKIGQCPTDELAKARATGIIGLRAALPYWHRSIA